MGWIEYSLKDLDWTGLEVLANYWGGREARNVQNALDFAKLYPLWYERKSRLLLLFKDNVNNKIIVKLPKLRAFRRRHYAWIKHIDFPPGRRWVLITLTLKRDISIQDAWCYINHWTSAFLERLRDYVRKVKKSRLSYLWVVEAHADDYPHVHILCSFPFIPLDKLISWWVDDNGNPLSASHGVDIRFIGDFENVKNYVVKYLVKSHHKYWAFHRYRDGDEVKVRVRLSTLFIWYFRVKLFGMSRDIRRSNFQVSSDFVFVGLVFSFSVWRVLYRTFNISLDVMWLCLMDVGDIERDIVYLSHLRVLYMT